MVVEISGAVCRGRGGGGEVIGTFGLKRSASFWFLTSIAWMLLLIAVPLLVRFLYIYLEVNDTSTVISAIITYAMVIVTAVYATILFWERWTDVPQLEIQTKDIKISKEEDFY